MRTRVVLALGLLAVAAASLLACRRTPDPSTAKPTGHYQRIVSMSPAVTEILFALGIGDRVVGVTRYCLYPPEAQTRAKVGGHLDPNYEAVVALKPDLIIFRESETEAADRFRQQLGIDTLVVNQKRLEGILESIETIGRTCDAESQGRQLRAEMEAKLAAIAQQTAPLAHPRVMIVADRIRGAGRIESVYVAGSYGFFDRLITMAGGQNACAEVTGEFPIVSAEGILQLNPDVIIDLVYKQADVAQEEATLRGDWQQLPEVAAVRQGRVYVVQDDYALIPGPRLVLLVEKLARLFHPELQGQP